MTRKINFGSGRFRKQGFINVDINKDSSPDIILDLNKVPYPFKANEFDLIEADHLLEHLNDPFEVMREFKRICRKGGIISIRVPHFSRGLTHPDHKRGFDVSFYHYFRPKFAGYVGFELRLVSMRLNWFSQPKLKRQMLPWAFYHLANLAGKILNLLASLSPEFCSRVWCFLVGGFEEIEFKFTK